jgi:hypothetical protein
MNKIYYYKHRVCDIHDVFVLGSIHCLCTTARSLLVLTLLLKTDAMGSTKDRRWLSGGLAIMIGASLRSEYISQ